MRYQVPQFIEIEDKIFGPLTIKQFLYVAGGTALAFIIWNALPSFIAVFFAIPVIMFFFALAFYKHNERPFIFTVESAFKYFFNDKLYIWKREEKKPEKKSKEDVEPAKLDIPRMSNSKLKELSWSLDVNSNFDNNK
jgi:hypothetical protein